MAHPAADSNIAITATQGVLVVTMQADMGSRQLESMRQAVLDRITSGKFNALVLDFSAIDVMDLTEYNRIRKLLASVRLLGAQTAIVSLAVGVVLYLTDVQADTDGIECYLGLDDALQIYGTGGR